MEKRPLPPGFRTLKVQPLDLPQPSAFRASRPAVLGPPPGSETRKIFGRKGVILGFGFAVAFHLLAGLLWWLTPPLRLKAGYAAERWVPVAAITLPAATVEAAPPRVATPQPSAERRNK